MSSSDKKQPPKKINNSYSLLLKTLSQVEKSKGSGSSSTKKTSSSANSSSSMSSKTRQENAPSSSAPSKVTHDEDPDVPDRSYGDYYCKICDSHMNSDNMWEAHVTGKKHIKNVTKGDKDTKYEYLQDVESDIKYELRNVKDPVVGLNYIHEIRRKEPSVPPIYNCFLCHASLATVPLVIEHVLTLKHRLNYIKENDAEKHDLINATNLKKGLKDPLVLEAVRALEEKFGRGKVVVKQEKKKSPVVTYSAKKSFDLDDSVDDDKYRKPKTSMPDRDVDMWKPVGGTKSTGHRERSLSPLPKMNFVPSRSRCKSPGSFKESSSYSHYDDKHDDYKRSFSKRDLSPPRSSHRHDSPEPYPKKYGYSHSSRRSRSPDRLDYKVTSEYKRARSRSRSPVKAPFNDAKPSFSSNTNYPKPASYLPENYMLPHERAVAMPSQPISKEEVFKEVMDLPHEQFMKICLLKLSKMDLNGSLEGLVLLSKLINLAKDTFNKNLPSELVNTINEAKKSNSGTSLNIPGLGDIGSITQSTIATESPLRSSKTLDAQTFINSILRSANVNFPASTTPSSASFPQQNSTFQTSMASSYQAPSVNTYQTPANSYQTPANSYQAAPVNTYSTQNPNLYQSVPSNLPPNIAYSNTSTAPGLGNAGQPSSNLPNYNYTQYSSAPKNFPRKY